MDRHVVLQPLVVVLEAGHLPLPVRQLPLQLLLPQEPAVRGERGGPLEPLTPRDG